jgi:hypothetical protein
VLDELACHALPCRADTLLTMNARSETRERMTAFLKAKVSSASRLLDLHFLLKVGA